MELIINEKNTTKLDKQLMELGFEPCYRGFNYLNVAIQIIRQDREYLYNITKKLYPEIAKACNCSNHIKVERCIRHLKNNSPFKQYTNSVLIGKLELMTRED